MWWDRICPHYCSTDREGYCDATGGVCSCNPYNGGCNFEEEEEDEEDYDSDELSEEIA